MNEPHGNFIAVDLGAGNCRIIAGRLRGYKVELHEAARFEHAVDESRKYKRWQWQTILDRIKTGLSDACDLFENGRPDSICCDSWAQDFGLLDKNDELFYPPVSYRDSRAVDIPAQLAEIISPLELQRIVGSITTPITSLCQLKAMSELEPEILDRAETLLHIADLVNFSLCGTKTTDWTFASASQLLDVKTETWAKDLLGKLGIPSHFLPEIARAPRVIGHIPADLAPDPRLAGVPVVAGAGHDTALSAFAVSPMTKGTLFLSAGTWCMLGCCMGEKLPVERITDKSVAVLGLADGKWGFFHGNAGLWFIQECKRQWDRTNIRVTYAGLAEEAEKSKIDAVFDVNDPVFFNPTNMPSAISSYLRGHNMPVPETPADFAKTIFDSLAAGFKKSLDRLEKTTGFKFNEIRMFGGGSQNEYLCRKTAEALKIPVITGPVEAVTVGNILFQAVTLKLISKNVITRILNESFERKIYQ